MKTSTTGMCAAVLWLSSGLHGAMACGHCVEDRIAAVYDHALLQRTALAGQQMAFFAWDGKMVQNEASRSEIQALAEKTSGVVKGSVRVSMAPAAIAVAFDPRQNSHRKMAAALQGKLQALKLSLVPLAAPQGQ